MLEKFVEIKGKQIFYRCVGEGEEMMLIHAAFASGRIFLKLSDLLSRHFKVIIPDLIGHGESQSLREDEPLPDIPAFLSDFMDKIGVKKAHMVGASRGGLYAMQFAARYPTRVGKLILINSAGLPECIRPPVEQRPQTIYDLFVNKEIVTEEFIRLYTPKEDAQKAETFEKKWKENLPKDYFVRGFLDVIKKVKHQTLIIWGEQDKSFPVVCGYLLNAIIKDSRLEVLPQVGHSPNLEAPERVANLIINFVKGDYS